MKNKNMHTAKKKKNDEFYTRLEDIQMEVNKYKDHFKGKTVLMNCDDPYESMFWKFFADNFNRFELKKMISTHYEKDGKSYKLEITGDTNGDGMISRLDTVETPLEGNGDFRSEECLNLLKEADIVVTNPPFSLFREFITVLVEHDKKFLVVGNKNAITYKETFKLIKDNKLWLGYTSPKEFIQPDGSTKKFGNIGWFTNLPTDKRNEELILYKKYNKDEYPKYDNYDAINVDKVKDMPCDYFGAMGVPITFLDKFNPDQFEIIGIFADKRENSDALIKGTPTYIDEGHKNYVGPVISRKAKYARIIIKRKSNGV